MPLRQYQVDAIRNVRLRMGEGAHRIVLVLPTGSGKTLVGGEVCRLAVEKRTPVLWIAHRTELISQACAALTVAGLRVGAISASCDFPADPGAPVQVASVQTLLARFSDAPERRPEARLLVWDECHHASESAEEWSKIIGWYPTSYVLGLTATPERGDGSGLGGMFDSIVVGTSVRKLTESGFLVPCEVFRPARWLREGRESGNPLSKPPIVAYREHACGELGLLFARNIDEAEGYAREFTEAGFRSACISERTPKSERASALAAFRDGAIRILTNVYVMTEGTDLPMASVCILARGASTAGTYLQMVGRVLRTHPGKTYATLLDLQGVSHVHGMPEDERAYSLDGRGIRATDVACKVCSSPIASYPCSTCGYDGPKTTERDAGVTEITNDPLVKYARKIAEGHEQRRETLARWLAQIALRNGSSGGVMHKWQAVYQEQLPVNMYFRGLADCTHDSNETVSGWAKSQLQRIREKRSGKSQRA